ncbi:MAG: hypothetical protein ACLRIS_03970 [Flavonifractor plautii]
MPQLPLDFPPGLGYSEQYAQKERTRHDLPRIKARYALTPDPQQEAAILRAEGPPCCWRCRAAARPPPW